LLGEIIVIYPSLVACAGLLVRGAQSAMREGMTLFARMA
jgi:hypothetical protein